MGTPAPPLVYTPLAPPPRGGAAPATTSAPGGPLPTYSHGLPAAFLAALSLAALAPADAAAQARIRGRLEDARTNAGVAGAVVELLGTSGERFGATLSDSVGLFVLPVPGAGRYQVRAVHADYPPALSDFFEVERDGQAVDLRLYMGIEGAALAPLEVVGKAQLALRRGSDIFDANQRLGKGRFITAEEIRLKDPAGTSFVLMGEEGVIPATLPDGTMVYGPTRALCVMVVVDGLWRSTIPTIQFMSGGQLMAETEAMVERIMNPRDAEPAGPTPTVDAVLMPDDLAGIEFYRESSEVPAFWIQHALEHKLPEIAHKLRFSCGLMVLWTKGGW